MTITFDEVSPTNDSTIEVTFTFNEDVTEFYSDNVTLSFGTPIGSPAQTLVSCTKGAFVSNTASQYTLALTCSNAGTVAVNVVAAATGGKVRGGEERDEEEAKTQGVYYFDPQWQASEEEED